MDPLSVSVKRRKVEGVGVVVCVMLAATPQSLSAQDDDIGRQIWLDYNPLWTLPSDLELYGDVGVRTEVGDQGSVRLVARPSVRGPLGSFRWSGGLGGLFTKNESAANRVELRAFQGIAATWPRRRIFRLDHYVRLEERLEWETDGGSSDPSLRLRYRLQVQFSLTGPLDVASWRLLAHGEGFLGTGTAGQFDERARIGVGLERVFSAAWRTRLDLTWQKMGRPFSGADTSDLYIRLRVFQDWME